MIGLAEFSLYFLYIFQRAYKYAEHIMGAYQAPVYWLIHIVLAYAPPPPFSALLCIYWGKGRELSSFWKGSNWSSPASPANPINLSLFLYFRF